MHRERASKLHFAEHTTWHHGWFLVDTSLLHATAAGQEHLSLGLRTLNGLNPKHLSPQAHLEPVGAHVLPGRGAHVSCRVDPRRRGLHAPAPIAVRPNPPPGCVNQAATFT